MGLHKHLIIPIILHLIIMINHWKVDVLCSTAANALFFVLGRRCAECQRLRCLIAIYIVWKYKIVLSFLLPLFFHLTALLYKWRCYCRVTTVESPHGCVRTDVPFCTSMHSPVRCTSIATAHELLDQSIYLITPLYSWKYIFCNGRSFACPECFVFASFYRLLLEICCLHKPP